VLCDFELILKQYWTPPPITVAQGLFWIACHFLLGALLFQ